MNTLGSYNPEVGDNLARPPKRVFTEYRDRATISGQNTEGKITEASGCWIRSEIPPSILHKIVSLRPARIVKILEVREQFTRGRYNLDERLDAVLDRLLADIKS